MTREDIIRMAREAFGAPYSSYLEKRSWDISDKQVERFAALVAAYEREACARIADEWATSEQKQYGNGGPGAAIRARGEK